jgi:hypothetical protein
MTLGTRGPQHRPVFSCGQGQGTLGTAIAKHVDSTVAVLYLFSHALYNRASFCSVLSEGLRFLSLPANNKPPNGREIFAANP